MPTLNWAGKEEVLKYNPPIHVLDYISNDSDDSSESKQEWNIKYLSKISTR